jgi:hypothetical protein
MQPTQASLWLDPLPRVPRICQQRGNANYLGLLSS